MDVLIDNRIILGLAEVAGSQERNLDKIFVFKNGSDVVFFASNGKVALKVEMQEPEFDFDKEEKFVVELPIMLKKLIKFNKKEQNEAMNKTNVHAVGDDVKIDFFNVVPYSLAYTMPEAKKFEELPNFFKQDYFQQKAIAFNPYYAEKLNKALSKLGFDNSPKFLLGDNIMQGSMENEEFIVEYIMTRETANA